ncbi:hypothetical protein [Leadbetterella byssophila]|uniref:hypothetical protein n=1 Tax=Leadbetterella byssophila TaxID=316068 RepID=UPI0039A1FBF0
MKNIVVAFSLLAIAASANAQSYYKQNSSQKSSSYGTTSTFQNGYLKSNGTYVKPHYKTTSNGTNWDNYSTKGNVNPYTGSNGSRARDYSPAANNYGSGKQIYQGTNGGQYYYNSNGNKTYVPKRYNY